MKMSKPFLPLGMALNGALGRAGRPKPAVGDTVKVTLENLKGSSGVFTGRHAYAYAPEGAMHVRVHAGQWCTRDGQAEELMSETTGGHQARSEQRNSQWSHQRGIARQE
ncbi:hypothetical protein GGX14DRAFT_406264 [Mycena pura]|uniref:Uncharacterized protein n=1 Tax=Mycena pura TaxID=153505 RepID=A0AAD6UQM0_9AGAR|nr:hypothetical protein GGX14DRAFT_406264 [Mycena pura]